MTDGKITTFGIVWEALDERNLVMYIENKRKCCKYNMYQFINEVGEVRFFEHLSVISALMNISSNKRQFESNFAKQFKLSHIDDLFEE